MSVDHRKVLGGLGFNLFDTAFAAQENWLVTNHGFDRSPHATQRFIHHRADLLLGDESRIGLSRCGYGDFRCGLASVNHRQVLSWLSLNLLDATPATKEDWFVSNHDFDRLAHTAQRLVHHGALSLLGDERRIGIGCGGDCDLRPTRCILGGV